MQAEINRIKTLIQETADENNWTGINAEQALKDINAEQAVKRINSNHLNIAELTAHLTCWNKVITKRLDAENYAPTKEEDFPEINELTTKEWNKIKQKLFQSFEELTNKLQEKESVDVNAPIFKGASSAYRNLHGQISHLHYHLGQIVLLKKIL